MNMFLLDTVAGVYLQKTLLGRNDDPYTVRNSFAFLAPIYIKKRNLFKYEGKNTQKLIFPFSSLFPFVFKNFPLSLVTFFFTSH